MARLITLHSLSSSALGGARLGSTRLGERSNQLNGIAYILQPLEPSLLFSWSERKFQTGKTLQLALNTNIWVATDPPHSFLESAKKTIIETDFQVDEFDKELIRYVEPTSAQNDLYLTLLMGGYSKVESLPFKWLRFAAGGGTFFGDL